MGLAYILVGGMVLARTQDEKEIASGETLLILSAVLISVGVSFFVVAWTFGQHPAVGRIALMFAVLISSALAIYSSVVAVVPLIAASALFLTWQRLNRPIS
jgi:hypothetical protein